MWAAIAAVGALGLLGWEWHRLRATTRHAERLVIQAQEMLAQAREERDALRHDRATLRLELLDRARGEGLIAPPPWETYGPSPLQAIRNGAQRATGPKVERPLED